MRYPLVIHKDPESDYGVTVPDLPGCFSAGTTLDEALENTREAIECHLEGLMLDGEPLPEPSPIEVHQAIPITRVAYGRWWRPIYRSSPARRSG